MTKRTESRERLKTFRYCFAAHKQTGFTLPELMVIVSIIGILARIATPQYQEYTLTSLPSYHLPIDCRL